MILYLFLKASSKKPLPRPAYFWSNTEVLDWMKSSLPAQFKSCGGFFKKHSIQGITFMTANSERYDLSNDSHFQSQEKFFNASF